MKILVLNYSFSASARQITFVDYNPIVAERLLLITNTTDGIILYNFADPLKGGTCATNVLTLAFDTTSMSDADKLQIFYDDNATTMPVSGTVTANLSAVDNGVLDFIAGKVDRIPVLGQALETFSVPVVLTAAQLSDLTPPAQGLTDAQLRATAVPISVTSVPSHAVTNAGTFAVQIPVVTGIGHGVKTVTTAGTDVALAASTACKKVTIQAQLDNTGAIAVGGSGVDATVATGTGIVLNPGDAYEFEIDNLADIYIDSLVSGEGVRFTYFT